MPRCPPPPKSVLHCTALHGPQVIYEFQLDICCRQGFPRPDALEIRSDRHKIAGAQYACISASIIFETLQTFFTPRSTSETLSSPQAVPRSAFQRPQGSERPDRAAAAYSACRRCCQPRTPCTAEPAGLSAPSAGQGAGSAAGASHCSTDAVPGGCCDMYLSVLTCVCLPACCGLAGGDQ